MIALLILYLAIGYGALCYDIGYRHAKARRAPKLLSAVLILWITWPRIAWRHIRAAWQRKHPARRP